MRLRFLTFIALAIFAMPLCAQTDWWTTALTGTSAYNRDVAVVYMRTHNVGLPHLSYVPPKEEVSGDLVACWDVLALLISHSDLTWKSIATLRLVSRAFKNEVARALRGRMTYNLASTKDLAQLMSPLSFTFLLFIGEMHFRLGQSRFFPDSFVEAYEAPQNHDGAIAILQAATNTQLIFDAALAQIALEHWAGFLEANRANFANVHTLRIDDDQEAFSFEHVLMQTFFNFLGHDQLRAATNALAQPTMCLTRAFVRGPESHDLVNAISRETLAQLRVLHLSNVFTNSAFLLSLTTSINEGRLPNLSDLSIDTVETSPDWPERTDNIEALTTALASPTMTLRRLTLGSLIPLAHVLKLLRQRCFKDLEEIDASQMIVEANQVIPLFNIRKEAPRLRSLLFSCLAEGPYLLAYFLQIAANAAVLRLSDFRVLVADYLGDHQRNTELETADSVDQMEARAALRRIAELPGDGFRLNPELAEMATASQKILDDEEFSGSDDEDLEISFRIDPTF